MRIVYATGPGDTVDAYRLWKVGKEAPFEMSIAFSKTFLDWCEGAGAEHVLSHRMPGAKLFETVNYLVENRPRPAAYWANGVNII